MCKTGRGSCRESVGNTAKTIEDRKSIRAAAGDNEVDRMTLSGRATELVDRGPNLDLLSAPAGSQ